MMCFFRYMGNLTNLNLYLKGFASLYPVRAFYDRDMFLLHLGEIRCVCRTIDAAKETFL
jgi:hypothetical protein